MCLMPCDKNLMCMLGPCRHQIATSLAGQPDHQGELLFLAAVMHLVEVSLTFALEQPMLALEDTEFQVAEEVHQSSHRTPPGDIHLRLGTTRPPLKASKVCIWTMKRGFIIRDADPCRLL